MGPTIITQLYNRTQRTPIIFYQWLCWGWTAPAPLRSAQKGETPCWTVNFSALPPARRHLSCLSLKEKEKTRQFYLYYTFHYKLNVLRGNPWTNNNIQQPFCRGFFYYNIGHGTLHCRSCIVPPFVICISLCSTSIIYIYVSADISL